MSENRGLLPNSYVKINAAIKNLYNQLIYKRSIKLSVIATGLQFVTNIDTLPGIPHETTDQTDIHHLNGTISMTRDKSGSAYSEFFICIGNQPELDYGGKQNPDGQRFAVFDKMIEGMEIVRKIKLLPADSNQLLLHYIKILKAYRE